MVGGNRPIITHSARERPVVLSCDSRAHFVIV